MDIKIRKKYVPSEHILWEAFYLFILALFLIHYFSQTILYPVEWEKIDYNYIHTFLFVYVFFKYAIMKNFSLRSIEGILAFLLVVIFCLSYRHTGYMEVLDTVLLILGAKEVRYESILKIYILVKTPLIILTIVGSQIGILQNLVYNQEGRVREAFGFVYPTDFAAQIFYVFVAWIFLRQLRTSFFELIIMGMIALFLEYKCDPRCSVVCVCVIIISTVLAKILNRQGEILNKFLRSVLNITSKVCMLVPVITSGFMIFICRFYSPSNRFLFWLNNITSQRLKLGKKIFDYYDVQLFGQYIEMYGNGGTTEKPIDYTFIDCSYINILMRFGLGVFILILVLLIILMWQNHKNLFSLMLLTVVCIHSMMEHHLFEIHYNFTLLLHFSLGFSEIYKGYLKFKNKLQRKSESIYY